MNPNAQQQGLAAQQLAAIQASFEWMREQLVTTRARVCTLEAKELLRTQGQTERMPIEFRSQFGEDAWIWEMLGRPTKGFFIEVGAFDGYHYSVSYALEAMGWSGLLIEGLPQRYEACRAKRSHSRVVHSALSRPGAPSTMDFVNVKDQYGGMLSYLDGQPTDHARSVQQNRFQTERVTVPVTTMDALLKDHTGPIDAAVLDVEGAELDVLAGFDLKRWRPRVLILEDNSQSPDSALGQYMNAQPYELAAWVGVNRMYVHRDELKLLENVRRF